MRDRNTRFMVDAMLGSLARWLRIMGYDARYEENMDDNTILAISRQENRILLTRDKELAWRMGEDSIYVESDNLKEQLEQVSGRLDLRMDESSTRCTLCNGELEGISAEEVSHEVPEGALRSNSAFYRCTDCGKVYWRGSHWRNIMSRIETLEKGGD